MLRDIDQHCRECSVCQTSKLPLPSKVCLMSIPVGSLRPWEIVAIDILEVPNPITTTVTCSNPGLLHKVG